MATAAEHRLTGLRFTVRRRTEGPGETPPTFIYDAPCGGCWYCLARDLMVAGALDAPSDPSLGRVVDPRNS